jgi:hypothetical protein
VVIADTLLLVHSQGERGSSVIPNDSASNFKDNIEVKLRVRVIAREDLVESPDTCGGVCHETAASQLL